MNAKWTLLALILCCCLLSEAQSYCSLDKMKKFAMEACEHLFQRDESRAKRSVDYSQAHMNRLSYGKLHNKHHHHYIAKSTYPNGGYLKVTREHFNRLLELDVWPRYKPKKPHHDKKREKREHPSSDYSNISYCCYSECNEEFFC
ncbi:uncharacterized protein LOC108598596 [Drosophila busckii]|uniref:uncharacterized protein LOC108598596 n=1 Tax=Drosophila busckii TaxID=30019 RepID=UPI00083F2D1E|nr:uncharacterized protein LOC108598596 [Drosophila busckii]